MKFIEKHSPPEKFTKYLEETPGVSFETLDQEIKNELKQSLLIEQGYICCYCGKRIEFDQYTILDHLACREEHRDRSLDYYNILASCDGGQNNRSGKNRTEKKLFPRHCDDKKNNASIEITPLCPECERHFSYDDDGNIFGCSKQGEKTIDVLALDCITVKNGRYNAIDVYRAIKEDLKEVENTRDFWLNEIQIATNKDSGGKFLPYCFFVRYYIETFCMPLTIEQSPPQ